MCQVSFDAHQYFQRYASDKLIIAKIGKEINTINNSDRVMVLAFCTFAHYHLSVYQVSFNYLQYFKKYALDNLIIANFRKGDNTVITCDRVMVLALCTSSDDLLPKYHVVLNYLLYSDRHAPQKVNIAKIEKGHNFVNTGNRVNILAFCNFPITDFAFYTFSDGPLSMY